MARKPEAADFAEMRKLGMSQAEYMGSDGQIKRKKQSLPHGGRLTGARRRPRPIGDIWFEQGGRAHQFNWQDEGGCVQPRYAAEGGSQNTQHRWMPISWYRENYGDDQSKWPVPGHQDGDGCGGCGGDGCSGDGCAGGGEGGGGGSSGSGDDGADGAADGSEGGTGGGGGEGGAGGCGGGMGDGTSDGGFGGSASDGLGGGMSGDGMDGLGDGQSGTGNADGSFGGSASDGLGGGMSGDGMDGLGDGQSGDGLGGGAADGGFGGSASDGLGGGMGDGLGGGMSGGMDGLGGIDGMAGGFDSGLGALGGFDAAPGLGFTGFDYAFDDVGPAFAEAQAAHAPGYAAAAEDNTDTISGMEATDSLTGMTGLDSLGLGYDSDTGGKGGPFGGFADAQAAADLSAALAAAAETDNNAITGMEATDSLTSPGMFGFGVEDDDLGPPAGPPAPGPADFAQAIDLGPVDVDAPVNSPGIFGLSTPANAQNYGVVDSRSAPNTQEAVDAAFDALGTQGQVAAGSKGDLAGGVFGGMEATDSLAGPANTDTLSDFTTADLDAAHDVFSPDVFAAPTPPASVPAGPNFDETFSNPLATPDRSAELDEFSKGFDLPAIDVTAPLDITPSNPPQNTGPIGLSQNTLSYTDLSAPYGPYEEAAPAPPSHEAINDPTYGQPAPPSNFDMNTVNGVPGGMFGANQGFSPAETGQLGFQGLDALAAGRGSLTGVADPAPAGLADPGQLGPSLADPFSDPNAQPDFSMQNFGPDYGPQAPGPAPTGPGPTETTDPSLGPAPYGPDPSNPFSETNAPAYTGRDAPAPAPSVDDFTQALTDALSDPNAFSGFYDSVDAYGEGFIPRGAGRFQRGGGVEGNPFDQPPSEEDIEFFGSTVPGRTDKHPLNVKSGSYILTADTVGALGEDNTLAGVAKIREMFAPGKRFGPKLGVPRFAEGGPVEPTEPVPVVVAGGEVRLSPRIVQRVGGGDLQRGHDILDKFQVETREKHWRKLKSLKGPKKD